MSVVRRAFQYVHSIFRVSVPEKQVLQQTYKEMTDSLIKGYQNQHMQKYLKSLTIDSLLKRAVELHVGSQTLPRNETIMRMLLDQAINKAYQSKNITQIRKVRYYSSYFLKMDALKQDDPQGYEHSSDLLMELAEEGHPLSNYLVGKDLYKFIESNETNGWDPEQLVNKCKQCFINSISNGQTGGLYYIADLIEQDGVENSELTHEDIKEMYIQAAAEGHPLSYFKLSQIYRKQQKIPQYKKYLLLAAEKGVVQAKHNLGLQYLSGEFFPKSQVKALAWFTNAAAFGFIYSKYNIYKLWLNGSSCGRIKQNKKAALIYLQEIHRTDLMDVEKQLQGLVKQLNDKDVENKQITKNDQQ